MRFQFEYTNHRGEKELRNVDALRMEYLDNPAWGYRPGWFLVGVDADRNAERHFRIDERMEPVMGHAVLALDNSALIQEAVAELQRHLNVGSAADFAMWLTTRDKVLEVGSHVSVYAMVAALKEFTELPSHQSAIKQQDQPYLGLATNAELEKELAVRKELGHTDPGYRTIDHE